MRSVLGGLLLLALSVTVSAQPDRQSQAGTQNVTIADLQGVILHVSWTYASRFRNRMGEFNGGKTTRLEVKIGPELAIRGSSKETGWADTPGGRKTTAMTRGYVGTIGVPGKNKDGSATILWLLEGNVLSRLGVFEVGGGVLKITFEKTAAGLGCSATVAAAREVGAGNQIDKSPIGGKMEILSSRLLGTPSCRVDRPRNS